MGKLCRRKNDKKDLRHATIYMYNRGSTYIEYQWMRDLIKKLMELTHEQWLGRNLMSSIALKMKEELARELDKLLDKDIQNITDKNRWMLDMDPLDSVVMSMRKIQYAIFELKAAQAQDKAVEERTDGKTRDFIKYCNIPGMCVPMRNVFEHEGCIEEERVRHRKQEKTAASRQAQINWKGTGHAKRKGNTNNKGRG